MKHRGGLAARLALAAVAAGSTLAAAEILLRWASADSVQQLLDSRRSAAPGRAGTVVCVGDSYTFGVYYRAEESYPGRLEQLLRAGAAADEHWSVVNAGIPAQNSAQVLAGLEELLGRYRPAAVVVLAGYNNRWNKADPQRSGPLRRFWESLALVRMTRIALADDPTADKPRQLTEFSPEKVGVEVGGKETLIEVDKTSDRRSDSQVVESCARDLGDLVERCRAFGAVPFLATYPSPEPAYEAPSRAVREVARTTGAPLVDFREQFAEELARRPYQEILIPGDKHPTERGHFLMARQVAQLLESAGVVGLRPEAAAVAEILYPIRISFEAGEALLEGPPHSNFRLLVAGSREPVQVIGTLTVPLAADDVFGTWRADPQLRGSFDREGRAQLELPAELAGRGLYAALAVLHDQQVAALDLRVRTISEPVPLP